MSSNTAGWKSHRTIAGGKLQHAKVDTLEGTEISDFCASRSARNPKVSWQSSNFEILWMIIPIFSPKKAMINWEFLSDNQVSVIPGVVQNPAINHQQRSKSPGWKAPLLRDPRRVQGEEIWNSYSYISVAWKAQTLARSNFLLPDLRHGFNMFQYPARIKISPIHHLARDKITVIPVSGAYFPTRSFLHLAHFPFRLENATYPGKVACWPASIIFSGWNPIRLVQQKPVKRILILFLVLRAVKFFGQPHIFGWTTYLHRRCLASEALYWCLAENDFEDPEGSSQNQGQIHGLAHKYQVYIVIIPIFMHMSVCTLHVLIYIHIYMLLDTLIILSRYTEWVSHETEHRRNVISWSSVAPFFLGEVESDLVFVASSVFVPESNTKHV